MMNAFNNLNGNRQSFFGQMNNGGNQGGGFNSGLGAPRRGCMSVGGILIGIVVVLGGLVMWGIGQYNSLVAHDTQVRKAWANVENTYQRRADLIPNLVTVVKGYAKHEKETFQAVTEARAGVGQVKVDPSNMTEEQLKEFQKAQANLGGALGKLIAVGEAYPELKANENFLNLQAQLEGTENRCTKARSDFNTEVQAYNQKVRSFPLNMLAGMFGFQVRPEFKAAEGSEKAPVVNFD